MRYSRQEILKQVGKKGQTTLSKSKVVVMGVGALGSVSSELLARAGVGSITLIDSDIIELSNLQRQSLFTEADLNKPKASTAAQHIHKINSDISVKAITEHLTKTNISRLIKKTDLVLDCTDNMNTRFLINEYCRKNNIAWIYAAAIQEKGSVFNILPSGPCLKCFLPKAKDESCEDFGILNSTSHITASIQVVEALKILLDKKPESCFLRFDVWSHSLDKIKVKKNPNCPVCKGRYALLDTSTRLVSFTINKCKTKAAYSVKPNSNIKLDLTKIKSKSRTKFKLILDTPILIVVDTGITGEIIIHQHGELQFKTLEDKKEIERLSKELYSAGGFETK